MSRIISKQCESLAFFRINLRLRYTEAISSLLNWILCSANIHFFHQIKIGPQSRSLYTTRFDICHLYPTLLHSSIRYDALYSLRLFAFHAKFQLIKVIVFFCLTFFADQYFVFHQNINIELRRTHFFFVFIANANTPAWQFAEICRRNSQFT